MSHLAPNPTKTCHQLIRVQASDISRNEEISFVDMTATRGISYLVQLVTKSRSGNMSCWDTKPCRWVFNFQDWFISQIDAIGPIDFNMRYIAK